jgi:hypothetical protein
VKYKYFLRHLLLSSIKYPSNIITIYITSVTNKQHNTQNEKRFDANNNIANNNQEDENRKETLIERSNGNSRGTK